MRQERTKNKYIAFKKLINSHRLLTTVLIIVSFFAFYLMVALISFNPFDPSWSQTIWHGSIHNLGGKIGAWFSDTLFFTFGILAYMIPPIMLFFCWKTFSQHNERYHIDLLSFSLRLIGSLAFLLTSCSLVELNIDDFCYFASGGIIGTLLNNAIFPWFNRINAILLLLCIWIFGLTLFTGWSWLIIAEKIGAMVLGCTTFISKYSWQDQEIGQRNSKECSDITPQRAQLTSVLSENDLPSTVCINEDNRWCNNDNISRDSSAVTHIVQQDNAFRQSAPQMPSIESFTHPFFIRQEQSLKKPPTPLPTMDLLTSPPKEEELLDMPSLEQKARLVEARLADYRIKAKVVGISPGPVITRFELDLAPGVKAARISNLSRDLARSLSAIAVRVIEVIPGKPYVGLELPNQRRQTIYLREVLDCNKFRDTNSPLALVLGKDISGQPVIADLRKMPHLLVAGTTGSGKSVGVNAMILSILYKATPKEVRFIMIDPKMLELSVYEGIPHLLAEVVTDMKDAANALRWCVSEMERRYKLMSTLGVRNLAGYNERIEQAEEVIGQPLLNPFWKPSNGTIETSSFLEKLPYIVVIVDEFADLMMVVGKKVEELITRLAQKARAAGIHLVLATQRPSVDVITGLIKANIPTRIAFTVSSRIDSRTILDQAGAESLLGMGDMLYLAPNFPLPVRVHGSLVRDEEVHAVVSDWKARGQPQYIDSIISVGSESSTNSLDDEELDPLFDQAVSFVINKRRASISSVQRQFRVGYNRAARIVKQMELQGVVSPPSHSGNREVLPPTSPK